MNQHQITVGIVFLLIAIISIGFYEVKKTKIDLEQRRKKERSLKIFKYYYHLTQIICISVFIIFFSGHSNLVLSLFHSLASLYLGAAIAILGICLFTSAKLTLGQNYSNCSDMYVPKDLIMNGVYKYIRHPIYTANLLTVAGLFVSTGSTLILVIWLGMLAFYNKSAVIEEEALEKEFGAYGNYKHRTGRFLPLRLVKSKEQGDAI